MRVRFLQGIAAAEWHFETGEIADLPEAIAKKFLGIPNCAVEAEPKRCPHCHGALDEPLTPAGPLESATMTSNPRRRG
jgi:hypothetical protein